MFQLKKLISAVSLTSILLVQVVPVSAQEAPPPPPPPSAPVAPPPPPPPPSAPQAPGSGDQGNPGSGDTTSPDGDHQGDRDRDWDEDEEDNTDARASTQSPSPTPADSPSPDSDPGTGGQDQNGQSGDAVIATGDATNSGTVITTGNDNLLANSQGSGDVTVLNADNGVNSDNDASVSISDDSTTVQENTADVQNELDLASNTGDNSASYNTGNTNYITTGNANVSGTSVTAVNTNVDGVMISEFNIVDDQVGDYVLDFAANCIAGCTPGSLTAQNTGNGADSDNDIDLDVDSADNTFQTNDATVSNTMVLEANSGYNDTNLNTGGDNYIATGDANVSASALTFANNNLAGSLVYGVVNIYGDLVGDIVFPEELLGSCCLPGAATVSNTANGANSDNDADLDLATNSDTFQTNDATIENVLDMESESGANDADYNTGGASGIITGDSTATAQVLNVANSNISGGNWWLVLVNEAGQWIGHILGGDGTDNFAGSTGTEFVVDPSGAITVSNADNGAGSDNQTDVDVNQDSTTVQTNTAVIQNNLDLTANSGHNSASYNTSGDSVIQTGDANVVANIVNFVNNNITGGGQLFVTVVNVFGSWIGDFVTPGAHQDPSPVTAVGGAETQTASSQPQPTSIPQPTSAPSQVSSQVLAGIALSTGSAAAGRADWSGLDDESEAQVAGFLTDASADSLSSHSIKPVVRINLAWLLLILPPAGILWAIRRRLIHTA